MLMIKNILFPTDFSQCAGQALQHALFLAKYYKARLHMLHTVIFHREDPHNPAHSFPYPEELRGILKRMVIERMSSDLQTSNEDEKGIDITFEELRGFSAADLILEYADEHDIDLIAMGTHGRRGLGYMFLGSITQEVVRKASCSVYTIRESKNPQPPQKPDMILVPVDFSDDSKAAISMAREVANLHSSKLQLLHVIEDSAHPALYNPPQAFIAEICPDIVDRSHEALKRIYKESPGPGVAAEFKVVTGHVVNKILDYIRYNRIDMTVMATQGLSALKSFFLGSVTEAIIRRAPCPVLTVNPNFSPDFIAKHRRQEWMYGEQARARNLCIA